MGLTIPASTRGKLSLLCFVALVAVAAASVLEDGEEVTGYDINMPFNSIEETLEAAALYDQADSGFTVTHVHKLSLSLYTTSKTLANSFLKRSSLATVKVRCAQRLETTCPDSSQS